MAGITALAIAYVLSQFYRSFLAGSTPALTTELGATKARASVRLGAHFLLHSRTPRLAIARLDLTVCGVQERTASVLLPPSAAAGGDCSSSASIRAAGRSQRRRCRSGIGSAPGSDGYSLHLRSPLLDGAVRGAHVVDGGPRHRRQT